MHGMYFFKIYCNFRADDDADDDEGDDDNDEDSKAGLSQFGSGSHVPIVGLSSRRKTFYKTMLKTIRILESLGTSTFFIFYI